MTISRVVNNLLSIYKSGEGLLQLKQWSLEVNGAICALKLRMYLRVAIPVPRGALVFCEVLPVSIEDSGLMGHCWCDCIRMWYVF